jgi:predicted ATPase/DNA-binding winged helix-turn-helix (wHTH) protein
MQIEFPPFRLDLARERLWRGDQPVGLRRKTWHVLLYLIEQRGRLVGRDELLDAVWPNVAVAPATLTQSVHELRRALGDHARAPHFIETVHRRGFRFIAKIRQTTESEITQRRLSSPQLPVGLRSDRGDRSLPGREVELARLSRLLQGARGGQRRIVFVTGEPGIGKTRLVRTFLEQLADDDSDEPVWIAMGRCVDLHGEGEAYLPMLEALDRLAREAGTRSVVSVLRRWAPTWLAQLPWLLGDEPKQDLPASVITPTSVRMLRECCAALEALAQERPLVLWIEDLHWSDSASVDLLAALAARPDPARLLVLATYRPVDAAIHSHPVAALKRSLEQQRTGEEMALELLDEAAVSAYLRKRLAIEPDPALATVIHEQTDGNPLFMVTVVDHFVAAGWLAQTNGTGWSLTCPLVTLREKTPTSLRALVEAQLLDVYPEELEALQAASCVGDSFDAQLVAAATGWEIEAAEKVCGRLAGWGLFLEDAGASRWPDGSSGERFRFLHAVFRYILYGQVMAGQRQQLHHRVAERLEAGFARERGAVAAEVALHFERGGDPERAIDHLVEAAVGVRQRAGDREAVAYFARALDLLASLPDSDDRVRQEIELRLHLWREVNASAAVSALSQDASLDRALELCDRIGDSRSRAYATSYRTRSLIIEGELDAAESLDEQRVKRASNLSDPVLLAAAHSESGDIAFYRGELDRARREHALCLSALEGVDPPETCRLLGHDPGTLALGYQGWTYWLNGRPDEARRDAAACLARAEACGYPLNNAFALAQALLVEQFRRDADAANALAKSCAELAEEHGFVLPYPTVCAVMSWTLAQSGDIDAASVQLKEGAAMSSRLRIRQGLSHLLATLAEIELGRGSATEGLAVIDEALAFIEETGARFWAPEIHRLKGELLRLDGDDGPAEACFQKALDVASAQGALSLELRAATSLARFRKDTGRRQEARPLLAGVYGCFSEGFDTADLVDAKSLLDSC